MEIGPVIQLYGTAPGDHPFSLKNLIDWCGRCITGENTYLILGKTSHTPFGYFIAFPPWELDNCLNVYWAFIAPKFRATGVFRESVKFLRALARFHAARGIAFETPRPGAWCRAFGSGASVRTRIEVEV